jgi:hypothetical protein
VINIKHNLQKFESKILEVAIVFISIGYIGDAYAFRFSLAAALSPFSSYRIINPHQNVDSIS